MTKDEIKNGAIVALKSGGVYIKVDDTLLDINMNGAYLVLSGYDEDMHYVDNHECDIMKFLNPKHNTMCPSSINLALVYYNSGNFKWTWERSNANKVKLRDLTPEQYKKWKKSMCERKNCDSCPFNNVSCMITSSDCWVYHKDLYSDAFLDKEIEIEAEE